MDLLIILPSFLLVLSLSQNEKITILYQVWTFLSRYQFINANLFYVIIMGVLSNNLLF